jgi:curved DNA-binding protein CbpA
MERPSDTGQGAAGEAVESSTATSLNALGVVPDDVARRIDALYDALGQADYYALLGVSLDDDRRTIQDAYHHLALEMHPDRHDRLKRSHPEAYGRINQVFKRLAEGYHVLMDTDARRLYNLGLQTRGETRHTPSNLSPREHKELGVCDTEEGRAAVMESLEARGFGDWKGALESMSRAVAAEPNNRALALIADSISKFVTIINR